MMEPLPDERDDEDEIGAKHLFFAEGRHIPWHQRPCDVVGNSPLAPALRQIHAEGPREPPPPDKSSLSYQRQLAEALLDVNPKPRFGERKPNLRIVDADGPDEDWLSLGDDE